MKHPILYCEFLRENQLSRLPGRRSFPQPAEPRNDGFSFLRRTATLCIFGAVLQAVPTLVPALEALPEGPSGIASHYQNDAGIAADPAVIFADDFESYSGPDQLFNRWSDAYHRANIAIATGPGNTFHGARSLELTVPQQSSEVSNTLVRRLSPERETLFLRFYAKFDESFNVLGSSHNGATISSNYCCPGVPADGTNKFFVSYEAWRDDASVVNPGHLNIYIYHPDQRDIWGDHFFPTGRVIPFDRVPGDFGPEFVSRPDAMPELGRWQCYELMVKVNAPGLRDGRIAMWLDGKLIADFPSLRLRDSTALKIDQFTIDLHVKSNVYGVARKLYDNVVAATSYIGPMTTGSRPNPPRDVKAE